MEGAEERRSGGAEEIERMEVRMDREKGEYGREGRGQDQDRMMERGRFSVGEVAIANGS